MSTVMGCRTRYLRWPSGEFIIQYDSDDPRWLHFHMADELTQRMEEDMFLDWLPPMERDTDGEGLWGYRLFFGTKELGGTFDNYGIPFGGTVTVLRVPR